jgi:hypothetical protein
MRQAWNHALSQARARRRRWGVLFFWRLRLWTLAGTFPVPFLLSCLGQAADVWHPGGVPDTDPHPRKNRG